MSGALFTCMRANAMIPASISPTKSTIGPTGLRMHQDEMLRKFMSSLLSFSSQASACCLPPRVHLLPWIEERTCREHDRLVAGKTGGDRDAAILNGADLDVAAFDFVLAVDDIDVIALVIAQHRALRQQWRRGDACRDPRLGKAARTHPGIVGNGDSHVAQPRLRVDYRRNLPDGAGHAVSGADGRDLGWHAHVNAAEVLLRKLCAHFHLAAFGKPEQG